jgi:hypothetical protein
MREACLVKIKFISTLLSTNPPSSHLHCLENNMFFDNANHRGHLMKSWGMHGVNNL